MNSKTNQIIIFGFILLLIGVIVYLILIRPDSEKPAIIKHETAITKNTGKMDSIVKVQDAIIQELKIDTLKSRAAEKRSKRVISSLTKKIEEQREQVQALIDSVPQLNAFVESQDSLISVQAERIDSLQTEKSIQWMKFNRLILASDEKFNAAIEINAHFRAIDQIRKKENRRLKKVNRLILVAVPVSFVSGVLLAK